MRPGGGVLFRATLRPLYVGIRERFVGWVERRNGIRTADVIELAALGLAAPERVHYQPTPWFALRRALPPRRVRPDDAFLDFGSGKGRVVFQAARNYPFKRVIGVELSAELNRVARDNIERNRDRLRCRDVQLVCADAVDFDIPDDVTVVFFYNPFTGQTFGTVIEHLLASVDRKPRPITIIYYNPVEHEQLMATGRVLVQRRLRGWRPGREWSRSNSARVYAVSPARSVSPARPA